MSQITLEQGRRTLRGPRIAGPNERTLARRHAHAVAARAAESESHAKAEALAQVKRCLIRFLEAMHADGREFQACDFNNWLHECGECPDGFEGRSTGGMFLKLAREGSIKKVGFRANSGGRFTNYRATPRAVYVCERVPAESELL